MSIAVLGGQVAGSCFGESGILNIPFARAWINFKGQFGISDSDVNPLLASYLALSLLD